MNQQWSVPAWAVVALVAAAVVLLAGLVLAVRSTRRSLARARRDADVLATRLDDLERSLLGPASTAAATPAAERDPVPLPQEFVITHLGQREPDVTDPVPVVPAPVFADLVLRESAVRAVTLAAGLRRALSPEVRHRIRFEMRREVKRARKQRRADLRTARRDLHARERAAA